MNNKFKFLATGLTNSCTKFVHRNVAKSFDLVPIKVRDWEKAKRFNVRVRGTKAGSYHRSIPHAQGIPTLDIEVEDFDVIALCVRDFECTLNSKYFTHHSNNTREEVIEWQNQAVEIAKVIAESPKTVLFSIETLYVLGDVYWQRFLSSIESVVDISPSFRDCPKINNPNKKWVREMSVSDDKEFYDIDSDFVYGKVKGWKSRKLKKP